MKGLITFIFGAFVGSIIGAGVTYIVTREKIRSTLNAEFDTELDIYKKAWADKHHETNTTKSVELTDESNVTNDVDAVNDVLECSGIIIREYPGAQKEEDDGMSKVEFIDASSYDRIMMEAEVVRYIIYRPEQQTFEIDPDDLGDDEDDVRFNALFSFGSAILRKLANDTGYEDEQEIYLYDRAARKLYVVTVRFDD